MDNKLGIIAILAAMLLLGGCVINGNQTIPTVSIGTSQPNSTCTGPACTANQTNSTNSTLAAVFNASMLKALPPGSTNQSCSLIGTIGINCLDGMSGASCFTANNGSNWNCVGGNASIGNSTANASNSTNSS